MVLWSYLEEDIRGYFTTRSKLKLNPTHQLVLLQEVRQGLFTVGKKDLIRKSKLNKALCTDVDILRLYNLWLKDELLLTEHWLTQLLKDKRSSWKNCADIFEINKYKDFIGNEISFTDLIISTELHQQEEWNILQKFDTTLLSSIPEDIYNLYIKEENFFTYVKHGDSLRYSCIPVLEAAYNRLLNETGEADLPYILSYKAGFLIGLKDPLIPIVDTPANRKEIIIRIINGGVKYFPNQKEIGSKTAGYRKKATSYLKCGVVAGRFYQAWSIIFNNPSFFISSLSQKCTEGNYDNLEANEKNISNINPIRQDAIALYIYYLQEAGYVPYFENIDETKLKQLKKYAEPFKVSAIKLQLKYNKVSRLKTYRIAKRQIKNIEKAIELLQGKPKSIELAQQELMEARLFRNGVL
jgi:hypothetical protein